MSEQLVGVMSQIPIPEASAAYKQSLYEVEVSVPKVLICTKFPCSFYIGASELKGKDVKSNEFLRPTKGQLAFTESIKLQVKLQQDTRSKQYLSKKVVNEKMQIIVSLYIRSDSCPAEVIVAGFVQLDLSQQIGRAGMPRKLVLEKCPDRSNSITLNVVFRSLDGLCGSHRTGCGGQTPETERCSSLKSKNSQNHSNLDEFFEEQLNGKNMDPRKWFNRVETGGASLFKKKLSIQDGISFIHHKDYLTLKNTPHFAQQVLQYLTKQGLSEKGDAIIQVATSSAKPPLQRSGSADCVRLSSTTGSVQAGPCQRCHFLEQQIIHLMNNHKSKQDDMKQLVVEMEDEIRRYIWLVEEKTHDMQLLIDVSEQQSVKLAKQMDEATAKHRADIADKERTIKQLEKCVQELTQQPTPTPEHILRKIDTNGEDSQKRPKSKSEAFLPGFLTQIAKSFESVHQSDRLQTLQASSTMLMDRNRDLLDTVMQLKEDRFKIFIGLREIVEEAGPAISKRLTELVEAYEGADQ